MDIRNRIVGSGTATIDEILFNPYNFRIHSRHQQNAMQDMFDEVGWVQQVIINKTTGNLIDGHMRVQIAARQGETTVPALYVELSEEEERIVLTTLDPIGAMAQTDMQKLNELVGNISTEKEQVDNLIKDIAYDKDFNYEKEWEGMPEFVQDDAMPMRTIKMHFDTEEDVQKFSELIGQQITPRTRYLFYPKQQKNRLKDMQYDSN